MSIVKVVSNGPEYWSLRKIIVYRPPPDIKRIDVDNVKYHLFREPPDYNLLLNQFDDLISLYRDLGVEVFDLSKYMSSLPYGYIPPNIMFMRDPMVVVGDEIIISNMKGLSRKFEPYLLMKIFKLLKIQYKVMFRGSEYFEGGDFIYLNEDTVLIGYGPRTSFEGAYKLGKYINKQGLDVVLVSLPDYRVHLDGTLMPVDGDIIVSNVDAISLYPSIKLDRDGGYEVIDLYKFLKSHGYTFINVDKRELDTFGANLVVVKRGMIISYSWNVNVIKQLRDYGFDVIAFDGSEFMKAGGGLHCIFNTLERRK